MVHSKPNFAAIVAVVVLFIVYPIMQVLASAVQDNEGNVAAPVSVMYTVVRTSCVPCFAR